MLMTPQPKGATVPANTELLRGVDEHGAGYRCRLSWDGEPYIETGLPTPAKANARILVLREMRDNGDPKPNTAGAGDDDRTLADAARDLRKRKRISGRGKKLRKRGIEHWDRATKPWVDGDHGATPLRLLRRRPLEATIVDRALVAPTSARNELQALKAIIRAEANPEIDQSILAIEAIAVE